MDIKKQSAEMPESLRTSRGSPDWREKINDAFIRSKPIQARIGNDEFLLYVAGNECCLAKNRELAYSSTGTGSAYVLARFFIMAKESMAGMLAETVDSRVINKCVLESMMRDALDTNLVVGKDAEKLKDVLSSVFWSKEDNEQEVSVLSPEKAD